MKNLVIAITGPAGAGKSTVAKKLVKQLGKCTNIEADQVKHFIATAFTQKTLRNGTKVWDFGEWELLGESIGLLASNFQKAGYNVIINGHINEPAWEKIQEHITLTHKFMLLPQVETTKARDKERHDDLAMGDEAVTNAHTHLSSANYYKDFIKIDTTNHTIDQTVSEISSYL